MSDESISERIERVRGMANGDSTWDLSENDIAALKTVLERHDAAVKAVVYLAQRIQDNPDIGYYCGWGTQVFYLTARAVSVIEGRPFNEVEKFMAEDKQPEYRRVQPEVIRLRERVHELQGQLDDVPDHRSMRG
jgi:hypothetical protein